VSSVVALFEARQNRLSAGDAVMKTLGAGGRKVAAASSELPKTVDVAYRTLREWILQGHLVAGQSLPEAELALQIGVSRTPVREAIGRLSAEGLVVMERYRKHVVAKFDEDDRVEIMELKAVIEGRASARAATRLTDSEIAYLRDLSNRMERAVREQGDAAHPLFDELNREFHALIWRAANSPRGERILETALSSPFNVLGRLNATLAQSMERACWYHHEIVSAFESRDPERARMQMIAHELSLITTHFPER
jgi:DNA-binding GntR family transcriptional regulator